MKHTAVSHETFPRIPKEEVSVSHRREKDEGERRKNVFVTYDTIHAGGGKCTLYAKRTGKKCSPLDLV